jgi:DNA topoisomerase-2
MSKDNSKKSKVSKYNKKSQREHVLHRPGMYIGSITKLTEPMHLYDGEKIKYRDTTYVPGFFKIFDEILVNARDHSENDPTCDTIKVEYNKEENYISVFNNGQDGIPVEEHPEHKMYVPSMIFGELLTSSNFDDSEKRTTGGQNGIGSKACSIYSKQFIVEVGDHHNNKKFIQTWTENMSIASKPKVSKYSKKSSYVKITFYPDLEKFGLTTMDDDHYNLFFRRVLDIAGTSSKLKVYFNSKKLDVNNFKKYISVYYPEETLYYDETDRWQVGCLYIPDNGHRVISFVNGIATHHGGTHVNYVVDNIIKTLVNDYIKKKNKDIKLSPTIVKENLVFFINSIIDNPDFTSQTKTILGTKPNKFGTTYTASNLFMKKLSKCGIVQQVIQLAKFKESAQLKKNDGRKQTRIRGIVKLEDANKAGGKDSHKCTLILTEGDSASGFARAGLTVIGRDYFGIFPLKGKLLNTREASIKQIMANEEINNLKQIIGLKNDYTYKTNEEFNTLRYGHILCLTDQDTDGSHIKGLLMNMFHHTWPDLLNHKGFITSMATPIIKAFKGKDIKTFYNLTEYEDWKQTCVKGYKIKYYKGLGTSNKTEAIDCFKNLETKIITYITNNQTITDKALNLAFNKKLADDRKKWLMEYNRNNILTYDEKEINFNDFIHKDLIHFSNDDLERSIPHIMDGLKPSQRKIIYGAYLRGLDKNEVKVVQLAGFVSDKGAYHHGEASLMGAIIGMAQNYIGSNNINLLKPNGNFGTRFKGGKDSASPRYIYTELSDNIKYIINKHDYPILNHQNEDSMEIEPMYYAPIIPMVLVNGAEGIGTGFSTKIPNYNPIEIINNLIRMIDGHKIKSMEPFYNKFKGHIKKIDKNNFEFHGKYIIKGNKLIITELPVGTWTHNYKGDLEKMLDKELAKKHKRFVSYSDNNTNENVHFEIKFNKDEIQNVKDIMTEFKLIKKIGTTNMHLYSTNGNIKKYNSIKEIMTEFYEKRLQLYQKRKDYMLSILKYQLELLSYKCKFILMIINKELKINNRKRLEIEIKLEEHKFPKFGKDKDDTNLTYNYLLSMPLYNLTKEKIKELQKDMNDKDIEYNTLDENSIRDMWKTELIKLKENL